MFFAHPAEPHLPERLGLDPRDLLLAADGGDPVVGLRYEVCLAPPDAAQVSVVEPKPSLSQRRDKNARVVYRSRLV